jgi:exopolyphosphatase/pppGpp-phosphohydrolase
LEIVDRETEADLAATGCTPLIDPQARGVLLFDIGGGSSELVSLAQSEPVTRGPPKPQVIEQLIAMTYEERVANACIGSERADLVLAGCAILEAIRRAFPVPRLRVADRGLREGILVKLMREDGVWSNAAEPA